MSESKNLKIKQSLKETRGRREFLQIKTYELKVVKSKIPKETDSQLHKMFLEAKWVYNHILSLENLK